MRATISGVTHKNDVIIEKNVIGNFLKKQKHHFSNLSTKKNVVYNKQTFINDPALNYLNINPENQIEEALKNIVLFEYYHCEQLYPNLGDYLLHRLFGSSKVRSSHDFVFEKKHQDKLIKSFKSSLTTNIAEWFFKNTNLNRNINIESYRGDSLVFECLEEFVFKMDYDFDFYSNLKQKEVKNYRFVLINGVIESVGEIHHLLHKANKDKEPYVIFCFGVSGEVKQTIIKNNAAGRLKVYPVCFNSNDETSLNILNDLAAMHNSFVVSSDLGQTISQEVSKDLPFGNKITFFNGGISLIPVASKLQMEIHKRFLKKRIEDAQCKPDVRTDILENRLKMFTGKRVNIYIPEVLLREPGFKREIDYYFKFLSNLDKKIKLVSLDDCKFYIPSVYIKIADDKKKSLLAKFSEIQAIVC